MADHLVFETRADADAACAVLWLLLREIAAGRGRQFDDNGALISVDAAGRPAPEAPRLRGYPAPQPTTDGRVAIIHPIQMHVVARPPAGLTSEWLLGEAKVAITAAGLPWIEATVEIDRPGP